MSVPASGPAPVDGPVVETPSGALRGLRRPDPHRPDPHRGDVLEFRGVPYARAPRFGAPEPVPRWDGVRDATVHGPISPQLSSRLGPVTGRPDDRDLVADEDCLTVVVRAPAAPAAAPRPVLVWFHGGAYIGGAGSLPWYDTARLVREGDVVTVSVNYRLGILGWLRLPGVSPGNLGLLDLLAALRWVRDHAAAFGGDPDRVTVAGQSAGAHALACLLPRPEAAGLLRRAVLQSGQFGLAPLSTARADTVAGYVTDALDGDPRTVPLADLLHAQKRAMIRAAGPGGANSAPAFAPVAGTPPLPDAPAWDVAASGHDVVIGSTADEAETFVRISPGLETIRRVPLLGPAVTSFGAQLATRRVFTAPALRIADDAARAGARVWTYSFDWRAPRSDLGACHCIELPFLFGTAEAWSGAPMLAGASWEHDVEPLGAVLRAAWLRFVHDGDPGWSPHRPGAGHGVHLPGTGTLGQVADPESSPGGHPWP